MMLQYIKQVRTYFGIKPVQLGRWGKVTSSDALEKRIDLANIDNCGPCKFNDIPRNTNKINSGYFDSKHGQNISLP